MKTSELIGPALDWAVAKCEGLSPHIEPDFDGLHILIGSQEPSDYFPSTDWGWGGPIIEREKFTIGWLPRPQEWYAERRQHGTDGFVTHISFGPTPLVAAMRCYVASKLGNEVEIPEELKNV